jgi:hypothetical protein
VAGFAVMVSLAPSASAAVSSPNGRVFFTSAFCGAASIKPDDSGFNCTSALGRDPTVAPNGSSIASTRGNQVSVMSANGTAKHQITGSIDSW